MWGNNTAKLTKCEIKKKKNGSVASEISKFVQWALRNMQWVDMRLLKIYRYLGVNKALLSWTDVREITEEKWEWWWVDKFILGIYHSIPLGLSHIYFFSILLSRDIPMVMIMIKLTLVYVLFYICTLVFFHWSQLHWFWFG